MSGPAHRQRRVHFVGIGGIGMCALAELLVARREEVTGSDLQEGDTVARLRRLGVPVAIGHDAAHLGDPDLVVFSSAVPRTNPELEAARRRGIAVISRGELLAQCMAGLDGIAVAGSHGKTTTTALVAHVLQVCGLDPTALIGGRLIAPGAARSGPQERGDLRERSGLRLGGSRLLVAEADESDGSFLRLAPRIAVVTNVEAEHLDHYGSVSALRDAFAAFASSIPDHGRAVLCIDDAGVRALLPRLERRALGYGTSPEAEWRAEGITARDAGMEFHVLRAGRDQGPVALPLVGEHNVRNALAALAVAAELDLPFDRAAAALEGFSGVERRFETRGVSRGVRVVDDYGHHPTEIRATLAAARALGPARLVVVFQPHRYTRTRDLADAFATAFAEADLLVVTEIYPAGEPKLPGVEGARLAEDIARHALGRVRFVADLERVVEELVPELQEGDLLLTLGAGDVVRLGPAILAALGEERP